MRVPVSIIFLCSLLVFTTNVDGRRPFWRRAKPTLPPDSDTQFYEKFQKIPSKKETAEKLITKFLGIPLSATSRKRYMVFEDTVAILDASGSVGECEFKKGRRALKRLMKIEESGYSSYYAGIVYSSDATKMFNFLPSQQAATKMDSFPYDAGSTNTQAALLKAKELFLDRNAGSRPLSRRMVFLVTDGQSNVDQQLTIPNAEDLKRSNVEIFVVAVGNYISGIQEMVRVASYPPEDHVLRVESNGDLLKVVLLAIKQVDPNLYQVVGKVPPPC